MSLPYRDTIPILAKIIDCPILTALSFDGDGRRLTLCKHVHQPHEGIFQDAQQGWDLEWMCLVCAVYTLYIHENTFITHIYPKWNHISSLPSITIRPSDSGDIPCVQAGV